MQLVGAFFIETLVWGFPNAFGVFLAAYLEDATLISQKHASSLLPLIGTLSSGLIYASGENVVHIAIVLKTHPEVGPVLHPLLARFPRYRRASMCVGVALSFCSLMGASYTEKARMVASDWSVPF